MVGKRSKGDLTGTPKDLRGQKISLGSNSYVLLSFKPRMDHGSHGLTPAERRIALALLEGFSNMEIGRLYGSSPRTVANQVASIYRKLGVASRTELVSRWAHALSPAGEE